MSIEQIVALLIAERDRLNHALEALQGPTKRIGRPPKVPVAMAAAAESSPGVVAAAPATKKRRGFTAAQRKAQSIKLKAYWKKRKAEEAKGN